VPERSSERAGRNALVLVGYDLENTARSLALLDLFSVDAGIDDRVLVLNAPIRASLEGVIRLPPQWQVCEGSNRHFEFSGYQEGLDRLRRAPGEAAIGCVVFANDTVARVKSLTSIRMLHQATGAFCEPRSGQALGLIHDSDHISAQRPARVAGLRFDRWLCSFFFSLDATCLRRLDWRLDETADTSPLLLTEPSADALLVPSADAGLRAQIETWLLGGVWHAAGRRPMSQPEFERLRAKAQSILNEKHLSARMLAAGIRLVDVLSERALDRRWSGLKKRVRRLTTL